MPTKPKPPRGIRNNNPGNLIITDIPWKGKIPKAKNTDGHFEQFVSIEWGIRAKFLDLIHDITQGKNTIEKLIHEFAPAHENNTQAYINEVSKALNISPKESIKNIDERTLIKLAHVIGRIENGVDINMKHYQKAWALVDDEKKKTISQVPTI